MTSDPWGRKKVLVLGDAMLDVWRHYDRARPNPEDPATQTAHHLRDEYRLGGALNVAQNLAVFPNLDVRFLDVAYHAPEEQAIVNTHAAFLNSVPRCLNPIYRTAVTPYTRKTRHVLDDKVFFREDEDHHPTHTIGVEELTAALRFHRPDAVVLTDYAKGALWPPTLTLALLREVAAWPEPPLVVLDLKPQLHRVLLAHPDLLGRHVVVKANQAEARALFSGAHRLSGDLVYAWHRQARARMAVMTCGEYGAHWATSFDNALFTPLLPQAVGVNTLPFVCGAGDVFTAVLTRELLVGAIDDQYCVAHAINAATGMVHSGQRRTLVLDDTRRLEDPFLSGNADD